MASGSKVNLHPREVKWDKVLGEGAFGLVRKGEYLEGHRAIKFLKASSGPRYNASMALKATMETQLEVLGQLRHSRIILPEALGYSSNGDPIIVTEYAEHGDLESVLATWNLRDLTLYHRLVLARDIAEGMVFLHTKKPEILHLDLKPGNILICGDKRAKIADLGIAEVLNEDRRVLTQCLTGSIQYASPEALNPDRELPGVGKPGLTTGSDVFSYGMVLYQLFTGQPPYARELAEAQMKEEEEGRSGRWLDYLSLRLSDPALLPSLEYPPPWMLDHIWSKLKELMKACWQFEPSKRPAFTQVIKTLDGIGIHCEPEQVVARLDELEAQQKKDLPSSQSSLNVGSASVMPVPFPLTPGTPGSLAASGASSFGSSVFTPFSGSAPGSQSGSMPGSLDGSAGLHFKTPFLPGPSISYPTSYSASMGTTWHLGMDEHNWLENVFNKIGSTSSTAAGCSTGKSGADSDWVKVSEGSEGDISAVSGLDVGSSSRLSGYTASSANNTKWSANAISEALEQHEQYSKLARRLGHSLRWLRSREVDASYSLKDILHLANSINRGWEGWSPLDFDVLQLTYTALDWLLGAWGAMLFYCERNQGSFKADIEQLLAALKEAQDGSIAKEGTLDDEDAEAIRAVAQAVSTAASGCQLRDMLAQLKSLSAYTAPATTLPVLIQKFGNDEQRRMKLKQQADNAKELEDQWNKLYPDLEFIRKQQSIMGDRYPVAMYLDAGMIDEDTRNKMLRIMKDYWGFWKQLFAYDNGKLLGENFWDKKWAGRGREYRELVEPLDIANWYFAKNKQSENTDTYKHGYHYADGIAETADAEVTVDNNRRPGRYLRLQKKEMDIFKCTPKSTLTLAHHLARVLGPNKWQDVDRQVLTAQDKQ